MTEPKKAVNKLTDNLRRELRPILEKLEADRAPEVQRAAVELREKFRMLEFCQDEELAQARAELAEHEKQANANTDSGIKKFGLWIRAYEEPAYGVIKVCVSAADMPARSEVELGCLRGVLVFDGGCGGAGLLRDAYGVTRGGEDIPFTKAEPGHIGTIGEFIGNTA